MCGRTHDVRQLSLPTSCQSRTAAGPVIHYEKRNPGAGSRLPYQVRAANKTTELSAR